MVNRERMESQLVLHEGLKLHEYLDTLGNRTIGVGYNITGRGLDALQRIIGRSYDALQGITEHDARLVLRADIDRIEAAVLVHFPKYNALSEVRQRVILDMAFNMGFKALGFIQTRAAIEREDWSAAVRGLFASKWAHQIDDGPGKHFGRCDRLGKMLLTNLDYTC